MTTYYAPSTSNYFGNYAIQYIPGQEYCIGQGLTRNQFEAKFRRALPFQDGFFDHRQALQYAIVVGNLTNENQAVVLSRRRYDDVKEPQYREEQEDVQSLVVIPGTSGHFYIPPFNILISFSQSTPLKSGLRQYLSPTSKKVFSIRNKEITFREDLTEEGSLTFDARDVDLKGFVHVHNTTPNDIIVFFDIQSTAYPKPDQEVEIEQTSRAPDKGPQVLTAARIPPNCFWSYDANIFPLTLRLLETVEKQDVFGKISPIDTTRVAGRRNYVEEGAAQVCAGQTAVILWADEGRLTPILVVYPTNALKMVTGDLVLDTGDADTTDGLISRKSYLKPA